MLTDLVLASAHHVLVFLLAAIIAAEAVIVRPDMSGAGARLLSRIDAYYGATAALVLLVGISRVLFGLKGWEAYVSNWAFWLKIAAFVTVGLLSIKPTLEIRKWRKSADEEGFILLSADVAKVRGYILAQVGVFALIPVFAATMARYGY
jgi:putative membrane protein